MSNETKIANLLEMTKEIVTAVAGNSKIDPDQISQIIDSVYNSLSKRVDTTAPQALMNTTKTEPPSPPQVPAVPIKDSVTDDYIICLEDGKKMKLLKRHLEAFYGMSPAQYLEKWNLPEDYPLIAPNYSIRRSALAKKFRLGHTKTKGRKSVKAVTRKQIHRRVTA